MDYDLTRKVLAALSRDGVDYVVFGAVALNLDAERIARRFKLKDEG